MDRTTASPITQDGVDFTLKNLQRFKPYPEYKDSGVEWIGKIPAQWAVKSFKRIAKLIYGDSLPNENREFGEIEVYGSNGPVGFHSSANTRAPALIVGRKGSYGKVNFVDNPVFAIDTTYIIDERCTNENLRWLYYVTQLLGLDSYTEDSAIPGLAREFVYTKNVPYISSSEQRAIANFLDRETAKIDALISKKERLIELLQEKRAALISQAVTKGLNPNVPMKDSGIEWLGKIPAHWKTKRLKFTAKLIMGQSPPSEDCNEVGEGLPFLQGNAEFGKEHPVPRLYCSSAAKKAPKGSHLISVRAPVGAVNSADQEYGIGRGLCAVCPEESELEKRFCRYTLEVMKWQLDEVSTGSTYEAVSANEVGNIFCLLPSIEEQKLISSFLDRETTKIDSLIIKILEAIDRLKEYRTGLISAAVTGKIDVRNVGAQHAVPLQES